MFCIHNSYRTWKKKQPLEFFSNFVKNQGMIPNFFLEQLETSKFLLGRYFDVLICILENIGIFQNFDLLKRAFFGGDVIFGIFFLNFGDRVPSKWMSPIDTIMKKKLQNICSSQKFVFGKWISSHRYMSKRKFFHFEKKKANFFVTLYTYPPIYFICGLVFSNKGL